MPASLAQAADAARHNAAPAFGFVADKIDLGTIGDGDADALRTLVAAHGVAVFRGQQIDDAAFVRLLTRLGPMTFTPGETPLAHAPELNAVSNVGRTTPPRSVFHTDSSYFDAPPAYTALRAVSVPESGGATLFTDQYAAVERLPAELYQAVAGCTMRHTVTGLAGRDESRTHPLFRRHPLTDRVALYLSTPERCNGLSGHSAADSERLIAALYEHSTEPAYHLRHAWRSGDVVIWDDRCTLHRGDHSATVGDRVLHRGMVAGEVPIPA